MPPSSIEESPEPLNWTAVAALYAAVSLGIVGMLYVGAYRNASWLILLGTGGGLTASGRVLERQGKAKAAQRLKWAAGAVYGVFFLWAGVVVVRMLLR